MIEAIKEMMDANPHDEGLQNWVHDNVPELKESEDEKIRRALTGLLKFGFNDGSAIAPGSNITKEDALAWLEKQGKGGEK